MILLQGQERDARGTDPLLGPDEHFGAAAIFLIEDEPGTHALEIFQLQIDAIRVHIDPVVAEKEKCFEGAMRSSHRGIDTRTSFPANRS